MELLEICVKHEIVFDSKREIDDGDDDDDDDH